MLNIEPYILRFVEGAAVGTFLFYERSAFSNDIVKPDFIRRFGKGRSMAALTCSIWFFFSKKINI